MAFMTHDEYLNTFGSALGAAASTPGIAPGPGQPPELPPAFQATQAPAPAAAQPGVSEQAEAQSMGPPREAAFGPAPQPDPGVSEQAMPAAPAFTPPAAPAEGGSKGKNVRDYLAEASPEESEEFADTVQKDMGIEDLDAAAAQVALKDPELAAQYKTGSPDKKWDRAEAAAFLMEFGLRLMQSSGSGEGNFASGVGGAALGAFEARKEAKLAEEAKADRARQRGMEDTEFDWKKEDRPGEVKETAAERTRREAKEKREQEAHEMNKKLTELKLEGAPRATVNEDNEVVFSYPGSRKNWNTGIKAGERDSASRVSQWAEQHAAWQKAAAGLNGMSWDEMTPKQQSIIDDAFFRYQKTGVNTASARESTAMEMFRAMPDRLKGRDPEGALRAAREMVDGVMGPADDDAGRIPILDKEGQPPAGLTPDELVQFYLDQTKGDL